jgi:hypothetical protein
LVDARSLKLGIHYFKALNEGLHVDTSKNCNLHVENERSWNPRLKPALSVAPLFGVKIVEIKGLGSIKMQCHG